MRRLIVCSLALAMPLAGCAEPSLSLSDDPVTRAAQCGVVATAAARSASKDIKAALPFESQARVLHYALLAGSGGDSFDEATAKAVLQRLPAVAEEVTDGKWQTLVPACDGAFPAARAPAALPSATLDAQLGCSLLGDFIAGAMQSQEAQYRDALEPVFEMRRKLDARIGAKLARAGQTDGAGQKDERDRALARIVKGGAAGDMLAACVARYG